MSIGPGPETQKTQVENKPVSKRAHRASRKRPALVIAHEGTPVDEQVVESIAAQPDPPVALEEKSSTRDTRRRGPGFFANIGKTEVLTDRPQADPQAVRLARAMRGKPTSVAKEAPVKEKKQVVSATPVRPRSNAKPGFKMRYVWGMVMYLLIADFLGVYVTNFMQANHIDTVLFTLGPIRGTTSTLIFLAILVIILVVMARFDLLPRSFSGMYGGSSAPRGTGSQASKTKEAPTFETRTSQPTIRQGVQGEDDDLYQEYRKNQRYFQKRDRKR